MTASEQFNRPLWAQQTLLREYFCHIKVKMRGKQCESLWFQHILAYSN